jgi:hypothetical protein
MKKLLLALLITLSACGFAPPAEAGGYGDRYGRYDRHYDRYDRPSYRHSYRHYRRPVVYHTVRYRRVYSDGYYCPPPVRYYSRPRVSFHIGF